MNFAYVTHEDVPKTLYHYTSLEALVSIVQSRRLWASNIRFLNDRTESLHLIENVLDVLRKLVSPAHKAIVRTVQERLGSTPKQAHFVASLSEKDDLLSQWRAYCPPGAGVSIGFPSTVLEGQWIANPRPGDPLFLSASLQKVRYLSPDHQKELQAFIERLFALEQKEGSGAEQYYPSSSVLSVVSPFFDLELIPEEEQKPLVEIALESIRQAEGGMLAPRLNTPGETTAAWAINFAPFVKHEAFKEECEWRKLISKDSRVMPGQKFRRGK